MKKLTVLLLALFTSSGVMAHSGRIDRCGGHNDQKHGGYHVHNQAKYCACHPDSDLCKSKKKSNKGKSK